MNPNLSDNEEEEEFYLVSLDIFNSSAEDVYKAKLGFVVLFESDRSCKSNKKVK